MITLTKEEAQQVLDALEWNLPVIEDFGDKEQLHKQHKSIETLRARLAQPEPEPVAWQSRMRPDWEQNGWTQWRDCPKEQANNFWKTPRLHDWVYEARALYTAPPQREWRGLTDEDIEAAWDTTEPYFDQDDFARAIEAKLKEKNTWAK